MNENNLDHYKNNIGFRIIIKNSIIFILIASLLFSIIVFDNPPKWFSNMIVKPLTYKSTSEFVNSLFTDEETDNDSYLYIDYGKDIDEVILENKIEDIDVEIPEGNLPIAEADISSRNTLYRNKTKNIKITNDYISKLINKDYPIKVNSLDSGPLVLILHTHTTESYVEEGKYYYNPKKAVAETRSRDDSKNVIAVGEAMKNSLEAMGIGVVHCTDYHDIYVFNESYNHSYKTVKEYLKMYPTIKYVIDLHRDSVINTNGTKIAPVAEIGGEKAAQIMIVVGSNDNGLKHDKWEQNLTLAVKIQSELVNEYGNLARPLVIRSGRFNQQLSTGMLLFEIGACGNTLKEAEYSARLLANCYGSIIKSEICQ